MKVYWLKVGVNLTLLSGMALSVMLLDFGVLQNAINAVIFILIGALNFKSCIQAIRLVLNKKINKEKQ